MSFMSFHPQTPQSPRYSPGTEANTSASSSTTSMTTALPTPAQSVNGGSIPSEMTPDAAMIEGSPSSHKRKRAVDDDKESGERELKKPHIEDHRLDIENLHIDVGPKFLLCRTPHTPLGPDISEDLFDMFGLNPLATDVARFRPDGQKNALRKTYKGHIKTLGVNGQFEPVKKDDKAADGLVAMLTLPVDEWDVLYVRGHEIENGLQPEVRTKLPRAMQLARGAVPKSIWDTSVLGDLTLGAGGKGDKQASSARPTAPNTPVASTVGLPRPKQAPLLATAQDAARPKRDGKKRRYNDSSFEGYDEGFPDDDGGLASGYSTGDGDMGHAGQKRRKKTHVTSQSVPQSRQPSYGPP